MNLPHAPSLYAASADPAPAFPRLREEVRADVAIIGGGYTGLSAALHLAEAGMSAVVVEANSVGWGASGRNGGQLHTGQRRDQDWLEQKLGRDEARALWRLAEEAKALTLGLIARHRIDCELAWGHMHVAIKLRQREELLESQREQEGDYGYGKLRFMEKEETRQWVASERYIAGLYDSGAGHLHPLRYTIGVGRAAQAAGVKIYEGSRVTGIDYGPTVTVRTERGSVRAKFVALCANVDHVDLSRRLASKLIGVASYIVATQPLGAARAQALLKDNVAVADLNWIIDYYRLTGDQRLLFGGRVSYSGLDPLGTARATRQRMLNVFPQLADVEIDYAWGGMIDITMSRAPNFGRLEPNVYYLQGYSGHGMVATTIAGKIVAEAIAGQAERFDVFARLKHHDFPGGQLFRRPTLVMAMTWFRLRDLLP
jgi:gamma-glutamylputrescine oxidase